MSRISFYISSHGFGHATREIEVINNLPESVEVEIVTAVPAWLFEKSVYRPYEHHNLSHDLGIFQIDSIKQDLDRTLSEWTALLQNYEQMAQEEARRIEADGTTLAVGDISPFTVAVAKEAGLESVIVANFSWDWIFADFVNYHSDYQTVIDTIAGYYRETGLLLRTPLAGDLSVFPKIRDIPLIVRRSAMSRHEARQALGIEDGETVALLSFGGHAFRQFSKDCLDQYPGVSFITFDEAYGGGKNVRVLEAQEVYHPNIVRACDVVISKLGYGIATECIAHQVPIAYPPRKDFPEYGMLEKETGKLVPIITLTNEEFIGGNWDFLNDLPDTAQKEQLPDIALDGGALAAEILTEMAQ